MLLLLLLTRLCPAIIRSALCTTALFNVQSSNIYMRDTIDENFVTFSVYLNGTHLPIESLPTNHLSFTTKVLNIHVSLLHHTLVVLFKWECIVYIYTSSARSLSYICWILCFFLIENARLRYQRILLRIYWEEIFSAERNHRSVAWIVTVAYALCHLWSMVSRTIFILLSNKILLICFLFLFFVLCSRQTETQKVKKYK